MKTNRHSLMAKGIMVLLSLLVLVFAMTYSWFTIAYPDVSATGLAAAVQASGDFEYAIGFYNNGTGGDYKTTEFTNKTESLNLEKLEATDGSEYNLLHDYKPIDVTGDGRTLIRPAMSYGNSAVNEASNDYSLAEPNVQYISFDLYFRSETPGVSIKLGDGSWAKGACEINNKAMTGTSADNKSTYGNFSKDAITGAVRIAFVPYDYSAEKDNIPADLNTYQQNTPEYLHDRASFIWLPRPDLHLNSNDTLSGWTLTTNSTAAVDKQHRYYNIFNGDKTYPVYDNTITPTDLAASSQLFTTISDSVKIDNYYYTKVNVRIWVEGTDTEARRATSGGKFAVNFKFTTT